MGKVVHVDFARPLVTHVKDSWRRRLCTHTRLAIHHDDRYIMCSDCKAQIDPFDAMAILCRGWERYGVDLKQLKEQIETETEELENVKRQIKREKAKLRRLQAKGVDEWLKTAKTK